MSQKAKDNTPDNPHGGSDPALAGQSARRRVLGDQLRAYYDSVANEPVPDSFADLLNSLADQSGVDSEPGTGDRDDENRQDRS